MIINIINKLLRTGSISRSYKMKTGSWKPQWSAFIVCRVNLF